MPTLTKTPIQVYLGGYAPTDPDGIAYRPSKADARVLADEIVAALGVVESQYFPTRAAAIAATIPVTTRQIMLGGYTAENDRGVGAIYAEVADSGTLMPWQFRSNGGTRRWQLIVNKAHQFFFGAQGWNGVTATFAAAANDAPAFQALADYCADFGAIFHAIPGKHKIGSAIVARPGPTPDENYNAFERGPTWTFDNNTVLKASASMAAVFQLGNETFDNIIRDGVVTGGQFHCNNLATSGIWVTKLVRCTVERTQVLDMPVNGSGIRGGTNAPDEFPADPVEIASAELICLNNTIEGQIKNDSGVISAARSGTAGIQYVFCSDNQTFKNNIRGVKYGIRGDRASAFNGIHYGNHFWNLVSTTPDTTGDKMVAGFYLYGFNRLTDNQHDGPFDYCEILLDGNNRISGRGVNYGTLASDVDGVAVLTRLESEDFVVEGITYTSRGGAIVSGCTTNAQPSKRIAAEVSLAAGVPADNLRKTSDNRYVNVVSIAPINLGTAVSAVGSVSGSTITLAAGAQNVATATIPSTGAVAFTFTHPVGTGVPLTLVIRDDPQFTVMTAQEAPASRTTTAALFYVRNAAGTLINPSGFSLTGSAGGSV
jgi:hypothetical protein